MKSHEAMKHPAVLCQFNPQADVPARIRGKYWDYNVRSQGRAYKRTTADDMKCLVSAGLLVEKLNICLSYRSAYHGYSFKVRNDTLCRVGKQCPNYYTADLARLFSWFRVILPSSLRACPKDGPGGQAGNFLHVLAGNDILMAEIRFVCLEPLAKIGTQRVYVRTYMGPTKVAHNAPPYGPIMEPRFYLHTTAIVEKVKYLQFA